MELQKPMKKDVSPPVLSSTDIQEYLDKNSDYSFEIKCLRALSDLGLECVHGGTYIDPITEKPREFDIRAHFASGEKCLRLAVECKNINESFPLVVHRSPRSKKEATNDIIKSFNRMKKHPNPSDPSSMVTYSGTYFTMPAGKADLIYLESEPVGKSCEQIRRNSNKGGELTSGDSGIYEKWAQALSSSSGLISAAQQDWHKFKVDRIDTLVLPVLVVPDRTLWVVDYDSYGEILSTPAQVNSCSYYVNRHYRATSPDGGRGYTISHLHFVTFSGLREFIDERLEAITKFGTA